MLTCATKPEKLIFAPVVEQLRLQKLCDEAAVVHWEQVDSSLPNAMEAHRRIVNGHFTRLSSPSLAHLERHIPEPSADIKGLLLGSRKKVQPKVVESQT